MSEGLPNKIIFEKRPERNKGTGHVHALFQICSAVVFCSVHLMREIAWYQPHSYQPQRWAFDCCWRGRIIEHHYLLYGRVWVMKFLYVALFENVQKDFSIDLVFLSILPETKWLVLWHGRYNNVLLNVGFMGLTMYLTLEAAHLVKRWAGLLNAYLRCLRPRTLSSKKQSQHWTNGPFIVLCSQELADKDPGMEVWK